MTHQMKIEREHIQYLFKKAQEEGPGVMGLMSGATDMTPHTLPDGWELQAATKIFPEALLKRKQTLVFFLEKEFASFETAFFQSLNQTDWHLFCVLLNTRGVLELKAYHVFENKWKKLNLELDDV